MARLTQAPRPRSISGAGPNSGSSPDSLTDLTRLLARLQQSILHPDAERERRLRSSEYERNKAGINLEYARTLLTKLEQDALNVKVHTRRQELQVDLNRKRDVFEQLTERLRELEDISIDSDDDDSDDAEDLLSSIVMTPSESTNSRDAEGLDVDDHNWDMDDDNDNDQAEDNMYDQSQAHNEHVDLEEEQDEYQDESTIVPEKNRSAQEPTTSRQDTITTTATTTTQALRSRQSAIHQPVANDTAHTTSTARSQLFGNRTKSGTTSELSTTATTEAILDHQRKEQDALTENLVKMAASLKQSSQAFSTSLEQEKDVLNAAGKGLERNELGLETASRRMGAIRKMSEGQGWLGRMKLYAMIFGLAVAAILLVFVMPKLRF